MKDDLDAFRVLGTCARCGKGILPGNAQVVVCRNVEETGIDDSGREFVTVIDSEVLLTLCAGCGNKLSGEAVRSALAGVSDGSGSTFP